MSRMLATAASPNSGSPGTQTRDRQVVDQQRRDERRQVPAGLAPGGKVDHLRARLGRVLAGITQKAWIWASSHEGPSGSAAETIRVRDGWRPVSPEIVAAARSPTSRPAHDHDEVQDARPRRDMALASSPSGAASLAVAPRSSRAPSGSLRASGPRRPAQARLAGAGVERRRDWRTPANLAIRSAASGGRRARSGGRPPRAPRCPPRSSGTPARACPATRR